MNASEKRVERAALVRSMVELSSANDAASQSRWRELDQQQELLRVQIEQSERASALNTEMSTIRNAQLPGVGDEGYGDNDATSQRTVGPHHEARSTKAFSREFEHYLRTGQ